MGLDKKLYDKLLDRQEKGTFRSLSLFNNCVDFYSNDYLGLSRVKTFFDGTQYGGTGSRLISGNSLESERAESALAQFFNSESSLLFNSGYAANIGLFSSVPQRGDTVLYDELIHASIRDGIRLSYANNFSFRHNDLNDLNDKLSRSKGTTYVAIESLYSMDGDIAPLDEVIDLCANFGAYLIVDEAHAAGIFGAKGRGLVSMTNAGDKIFARIITFGKAFGAHGACVLGDKNLTDYLINYARSFIYTTAMPPEACWRIESLIDREANEIERKKLFDKINLFREMVSNEFLVSNQFSPIQIYRAKEISKLNHLTGLCHKNNLAVKPIFSPTVKQGEERLRICLHSFNSDEEVKFLADLIQEHSTDY